MVSTLSLDEDRTYGLLVLDGRHAWADEAVPELLRHVATETGPDTEITDAFSVEVFEGERVRPPSGRGVWWREDFVDESA